MRKTLLLFTSLLVIAIYTQAQSIVGNWEGKLDVNGTALPLALHISDSSGKLHTTMDSPMQGAFDLEADESYFNDGQYTMQLKKFGVLFKGTLNAKGDAIEGTLTQGGAKLPLTFNKASGTKARLNRPQEPKPPFAYSVTEVSINNTQEDIKLAGSLTLPQGATKATPIVVMITGSGAQNRDEEIFGHKPFLLLADELAKAGIGSLRMDDRGVGNSEEGSDTATSKNFATDIDAAINYLKANGYSKVGLLGHSEGGLIGSIVGSQRKDVAFLVMMAGPGIRGKELLKLQTEAMARIMGMPDKPASYLADQNDKLNTYILQYKGNNYKEDVRKQIAQSITDTTMGEEARQKAISQAAEQVDNNWYRYFVSTDPAFFIEKIKCPILALNGTKDLQVLYQENLAGIERALKKAGNKKYKTVAVEGVNHLFQTAKTGSVIEYGQIEETIAPKVLHLITSWIKQQAP